MPEVLGVFAAIEGGDGSGKGTQANILETRARSEGYDVLKVSFPRYGEDSAIFAGRYLNGDYGEANEVHPELASLAYAIDRFASGALIRAHLLRPRSLVITDRFVGSNLAHQGTKVPDFEARKKFYDDILRLEYVTLGLPRPDINVVLTVPSAIAQSNVDKKEARTYTTRGRDIHEADANHLDLATANYHELCELYPEEFTQIKTMSDDQESMRSIEEINDDVWNLVSPLVMAKQQ